MEHLSGTLIDGSLLLKIPSTDDFDTLSRKMSEAMHSNSEDLAAFNTGGFLLTQAREPERYIVYRPLAERVVQAEELAFLPLHRLLRLLPAEVSYAVSEGGQPQDFIGGAQEHVVFRTDEGRYYFAPAVFITLTPRTVFVCANPETPHRNYAYNGGHCKICPSKIDHTDVE